jgi:hypothetical protein
MKYARITLTVAFEDYGIDSLSALDTILPTLQDELPPEVTVLEFDERPMLLLVDYAAEKADQ